MSHAFSPGGGSSPGEAAAGEAHARQGGAGDVDPRADGSHLSALLALELRREDGVVTGLAPVRPEAFAPGTTWLRTSLLAAIVDHVAGHTPGGPGHPATGATMDLRTVVLAPPPVAGELRLRCRPLRVGRRLVVSETEVFSDSAATPFARATATFSVVEQPFGLPVGRPRPGPVGADSFDDILGMRVRDAATFVVDRSPRIANGVMGTVHGGAQALFVEVAADRVTAARERGLVATDLDVRFLDRLRVGPLVASVRSAASITGAPLAVVTLSDGGDGDRTVGHGTVVYAPRPR